LTVRTERALRRSGAAHPPHQSPTSCSNPTWFRLEPALPQGDYGVDL